MLQLPNRVSLVEMGPRDGLQSLTRVYPLETRRAMIVALAKAGLRRIEVTSFVRPDVVPQLAEAEQLVARLPRIDGCTYRALVANRRGAERAAAAGMAEVAALLTASETYALKNQNMTVEQNVAAVTDIASVCRQNDTRLVVTIALAMYCPYAGETPKERVLALTRHVIEHGAAEIVIASSAGLDGPRRVYELCAEVHETWPEVVVGVHLHDANGMALANALAAMQAGVTVLESSICGIGGGIRMPAAHPPNGNVPTEDLVNLLTELDVDCGIALADVLDVSDRVQRLLELDVIRSYARTGATKTVQPART